MRDQHLPACEHCGAVYKRRHSRQRTCSNDCWRKLYYKEHKEKTIRDATEWGKKHSETKRRRDNARRCSDTKMIQNLENELSNKFANLRSERARLHHDLRATIFRQCLEA